MSEELIEEGAEFPVSAELRELVDKFIDGRLSAEDHKRLEGMLESDSQALAYCAERMRLHAEMEAVLSPVRVELTQKRRMVVETKKGESTVSRAVSHVVKVENPRFGKSMELPPSGSQSKRLWIAAVVVLLIGTLALLFTWQGGSEERKLQLRNASFEDLKINENGAPFIYTILDWQDYFQSNRVRVCDVARASQGAMCAYDGDYAVLMDGGFLTQRLTYTDGSPFVARRGLRLRVSGWAMLGEAGERVKLSISSRVVVSAYPSMVQVEPDVQQFQVTEASWQPFELVLRLPNDSLVMEPTIFRAEVVEKQPSIVNAVDITGLQLAISIDNKSKAPLYLDHLKIEVLEDE